ncbi:MAG TPA: DUF695 domain-containing protein [Kofleriaceae bacterium]|jgi:hypothetical protein
MSTDEFDFYPCPVDGAPASIYVNLRFEDEAVGGADTLYTVGIRMRDKGEHGIGSSEEGADLNLVEESVITRAIELGITYVGRLRTAGVWEIVLYGPAEHLAALQTIAAEHAGHRRLEARAVRDADWSYYKEVLLPDAERRQWMDDRRMVQILTEQGDRLPVPRRVDHRIAFPTTEARDAFIAAVSAAGFRTGVADSDHVAHVYRTDAIELDHIHEVVMTLIDSAAPHQGRYERWEAGIQS